MRSLKTHGKDFCIMNCLITLVENLKWRSPLLCMFVHHDNIVNLVVCCLLKDAPWWIICWIKEITLDKLSYKWVIPTQKLYIHTFFVVSTKEENGLTSANWGFSISNFQSGHVPVTLCVTHTHLTPVSLFMLVQSLLANDIMESDIKS